MEYKRKTSPQSYEVYQISTSSWLDIIQTNIFYGGKYRVKSEVMIYDDDIQPVSLFLSYKLDKAGIQLMAGNLSDILNPRRFYQINAVQRLHFLFSSIFYLFHYMT